MKTTSSIAAVFALMVGVIACFCIATPKADTSQAGLERAQFTRQISALEAELSDFRRAQEEFQATNTLETLEQELLAPTPKVIVTESNKQQVVDLELGRLLQLKSAAQAAMQAPSRLEAAR